jgi:hypothetical protein
MATAPPGIDTLSAQQYTVPRNDAATEGDDQALIELGMSG